MKYVIFFIFLILLLFTNIFIIKDSYKFIIPIFMVNPAIYKIISIFLLFILMIAPFIYIIKNHFKLELIGTRLIIILIINYLLYTCYNIFTFILISPFLLFATKLFHFISTLYLNEEIVAQNKISANILIPYIIWTFYLTLTSISMFFINNC